MHRVPLRLLFLAFAFAVPACSTLPTVPEIRSALIEPSELKPGDTAIVSVQILDRYTRVKQVQGVVKQDQTITLVLKDDGVAPDMEAGDGLWTLKVDVPFNAPPGGFTFKISAFDLNGNLIIVRDENNEATGMSTTFTLKITYPDSDTIIGEDAPK